MSLGRHIDPEDIIHHLESVRPPSKSTNKPHHLTAYSTPYTSQRDIPKYEIPREGAPSDTVYSMINDELDLDGRPNLNLASFVDTYLDPNARKLFTSNLAKNLADNDEYPALLSMSERCVSILANLWGASKSEHAVGSPTVGSSEAVHLAGLSLKRRWQAKMKAQGKSIHEPGPNIIMGSNAQVALLKFARYFEVDARILPVSEKSDFCLDPDLVRENVDENTIGVFVILGSTYTGHYEPVERICQLLDEIQKEKGWDVDVHVDAASGGFVAPFTYAGAGQKWNFELPRVKSINVSGHKYGLVTPGIGWIVWRDEKYLPEELIFELHYLGGTEKSYTLNFSRPGAQVVVQYYNLIHLGFGGYREIMENCLANARVLSRGLEETGWYTCVSDIHRPVKSNSVTGRIKAAAETVTGSGTGGEEEEEKETSAGYTPGLPVVSFRFTDEFKQEFPHIKQEDVSLLLRARQWIIPNYALPPNEDKTEILRVVIRESMSFDLLDRLVTDIVQVTEQLIDHDEVDLSIMRKQRGRKHPNRKTDKGKGESVKEKVGEEVKRLNGGIHRSVC
ncbi:pyridoxal phosphate-dependent transferase [Triangularia verruculosa]|uniref:Glutamate decarboxylase n=1 Tax=Triangularia verruculosa TaxID=2587418 RepID=A0AAN6XJP6_9PEZI|nr:pyridoxal phosphate-dependent transferase [Triangularia verruculosa]